MNKKIISTLVSLLGICPTCKTFAVDIACALNFAANRRKHIEELHQKQGNPLKSSKFLNESKNAKNKLQYLNESEAMEEFRSDLRLIIGESLVWVKYDPDFFGNGTYGKVVHMPWKGEFYGNEVNDLVSKLDLRSHEGLKELKHLLIKTALDILIPLTSSDKNAKVVWENITQLSLNQISALKQWERNGIINEKKQLLIDEQMSNKDGEALPITITLDI